MDTNLNLKAPAPNIQNKQNSNTSTKSADSTNSNASNSAETTQRIYNKPKVGVVEAAAISNTPMGDTISLKKQENPHMKYKIQTKKTKYQKEQTIASIAIGILGFLALFGIKKHK